ncbi:acetoacetyl-CoA reductase [Janthinobacterium sp.]|uniref:acetoacetyl-CoA reductase n=1 Tax=Janthinobacterium sp. TaxID=1871054 RepID=UPI00293D9A47|nr:acetoacetyl-CoA reductase [Janthinobacterium sp.]
MQRFALVSGGSRGLGKASAIALQAAGHRVAVVYHRNEAAAAAFSNATAIPAFQWDVGNFEACRAGIAAVESALGPVDILVNNAGVTSDAMLHRMTEQQWWQVINTNLGSMFNMSRNVIEGMRERHHGRIINISSINGQKGQVGQCNYSAAKAGVLGFTKALALESARKNVTVNAIAPGYCDTEMLAGIAPEILEGIVGGIPVGRLGTPADVARMVVFLAAEEAGFITGATFEVNGGQYLD